MDTSNYSNMSIPELRLRLARSGADSALQNARTHQQLSTALSQAEASSKTEDISEELRLGREVQVCSLEHVEASAVPHFGIVTPDHMSDFLSEFFADVVKVYPSIRGSLYELLFSNFPYYPDESLTIKRWSPSEYLNQVIKHLHLESLSTPDRVDVLWSLHTLRTGLSVEVITKRVREAMSLSLEELLQSIGVKDDLVDSIDSTFIVQYVTGMNIRESTGRRLVELPSYSYITRKKAESVQGVIRELYFCYSTLLNPEGPYRRLSQIPKDKLPSSVKILLYYTYSNAPEISKRYKLNIRPGKYVIYGPGNVVSEFLSAYPLIKSYQEEGVLTRQGEEIRIYPNESMEPNLARKYLKVHANEELTTHYDLEKTWMRSWIIDTIMEDLYGPPPTWIANPDECSNESVLKLPAGYDRKLLLSYGTPDNHICFRIESLLENIEGFVNPVMSSQLLQPAYDLGLAVPGWQLRKMKDADFPPFPSGETVGAYFSKDQIYSLNDLLSGLDIKNRRLDVLKLRVDTIANKYYQGDRYIDYIKKGYLNLSPLDQVLVNNYMSSLLVIGLQLTGWQPGDPYDISTLNKKSILSAITRDVDQLKLTQEAMSNTALDFVNTLRVVVGLHMDVTSDTILVASNESTSGSVPSLIENYILRSTQLEFTTGNPTYAYIAPFIMSTAIIHLSKFTTTPLESILQSYLQVPSVDGPGPEQVLRTFFVDRDASTFSDGSPITF